MDVPDSLKYYCHHADHPERQAVKCHSGGGSVMGRAAFSRLGKTELKFISGGQDVRQYTETLSSHLLPFVRKNDPSGNVYQHDNALSHHARLTKTWLDTNNVVTMSWPAMSPDLNPIENSCGILTREVYAHGRQFSSQEVLKSAIVKAWRDLDLTSSKTY
uniref:GK10162 putative n=1 Tax=Albugo laibachii Nc14 TaxID=890382 RepID=F0X0K7_9STRA|nr:GK10162 putative [Albugo laibachii Nc14]|eukprot:CCA27298.1 GK10162 putative [Albugo laibachii Nc14]